MSTNQQKNQDEEVDLGKLFIIIGRGFSQIFNFFGSLLKNLFDLLIRLLVFLRNNFVKLFVAGFIGATVGGYFHFTNPHNYGSDMIVKPNFNSVRQLYNNITYYDDLVKQKDTIQLASIFGLTVKEASSLTKFKIEPVKVQSDIVSNYDDMVLQMDTLTISNYSFENYKSNFTDYDYKFHKVHVESKDKYIFPKLGNTIIASLIQNDYFKKVKESNQENLSRTDSILRNDLRKLDSLRITYMKVLLEEARKPNSGTNIDLGGTESKAKEIELFKSRSELNRELAKVVMDESESSEVVNILSDFQKTGYKIRGIEKSPIFQGGLIAILTMLLFLLLSELNNFLKNYQEND